MSLHAQRATLLGQLSEARIDLVLLIDALEKTSMPETAQSVPYRSEILPVLYHALGQIEESIARSVSPSKITVRSTNSVASASVGDTLMRADNGTTKKSRAAVSDSLSKLALLKALWFELHNEAYIRFLVFSVMCFIAVTLLQALGFDIEDKWYNWLDFADFVVPPLVMHIRDIPHLGFIGLGLSFIYSWLFNPVNVIYVAWRVLDHWPDDLTKMESRAPAKKEPKQKSE